MTAALFPLPAPWRPGPSSWAPGGRGRPYGRGLLRPDIGPTDGLGQGPLVLGPGPPPGMPGEAGGGTFGPSPFMRSGLITAAESMTPTQIFAYQRMGFMPGHATNILARVAQSGCCPGARAGTGPASDPSSYASGERTIQCANGASYTLDNWAGGIRAIRSTGGGPAECERIYEGTWSLVERGADATAGLGGMRWPTRWRPGAWSWRAPSGALACRMGPGATRAEVQRHDGSCEDCARPLLYDSTGRAVYGTAPPEQCRPGGRCSNGLGNEGGAGQGKALVAFALAGLLLWMGNRLSR